MGRGAYASLPVVGSEMRRGRNNAGAPLLSPDQVRDIRTLADGGISMYRLAIAHGISAQAIAKVVRRQSHKHIE